MRIAAPGHTRDGLFDRAVENLCTAMQTSERDFPQSELDDLLRILQSALHASRSYLTDAEVSDTANDAIVEFCERAAEGKVRCDDSPAGYLLGIARNLATKVRRSSEEPLDDDPEDPEAARLFAQIEDAASLRALMRAAIAKSDLVAADVLATLWDMTSTEDRVPSSRKLGARIGLSHTGVRKALERLRTYWGAV